MKGIELQINEDGTAEIRKEPYMTIECETEEDFEFIRQAINEKNERDKAKE